tara:strand:+ start:276 stop:719 length:444 start_codon:yes stop_codon:yes gene_type:complete
MTNNIYIYTDGACRGNPGPGGWGALLVYKKSKKELYGFSAQTTNNIMELTAVIKSLQSIKKTLPIIVTTDSNYVKDGITTWIKSWKQNNWRTSNKKPVKNKELWMQLDNLSQLYTIDWQWVKGHSGHPENEQADYLANKAIDENLLG